MGDGYLSEDEGLVEGGEGMEVDGASAAGKRHGACQDGNRFSCRFVGLRAELNHFGLVATYFCVAGLQAHTLELSPK